MAASDDPALPPSAGLSARKRRRVAASTLGALGLLLLAGCGSNMRAALQTAHQAWDSSQRIPGPDARLQPSLDYLRVQIGRQAGLMVRAADETDIHGATSRWYSADGAVLRLAQGRLVGLSDGARSWQLARGLAAVDWRAVAQGQDLRETWVVDLQPGYRIGLRAERHLRLVLTGPAEHALAATGPGVRWFQETDSRDARLATWYAVDLSSQPARVVHGQTCLELDWCLHWQPWPPRGRP